VSPFSSSRSIIARFVFSLVLVAFRPALAEESPALVLPTSTLTLPTITLTLPTLPPLPPTMDCAALDCDDRNPCTDDSCDPILGCLHLPLTGPACDDGDPCTTDDRCTLGLCAGALVGCTLPPPCPGGCDDGVSCTDDVCTVAGCLHVPVDSRCVPSGECTSAMCAPGLSGADAAGCVAGSPEADGAPCAEDTDACTVDVCRGGACKHERSTDTTACAPVQGVFRQTIALRAVTQDLLGELDTANPGGVGALVSDLSSIEASLAAAERALEGGEPGPAPAVFHPAVASSVAANERAHIAFTEVLHTPRQVALFLEALSRAQQRAAIQRSVARMLRRGARGLLNGTRVLRSDLRRLQRGPTATASSRRRAHVTVSGTWSSP